MCLLHCSHRPLARVFARQRELPTPSRIVPQPLSMNAPRSHASNELCNDHRVQLVMQRKALH
eukprot:m.476413 g.476413  ORF g.476413 m.476413 type:complete len:62 (-) comp40808_c0_seq1:79-264(-)